MKKILLILLGVAIVFTPGLAFGKVKLKYKKAHFAFMGDASKAGEKLKVHWSRPHPGKFVWGKVEFEKGVYNWKKIDKEIRRNQKYKSEIMATLWPYAEWDQKNCRKKLKPKRRSMFKSLGKYRNKPCDMKRYKEWVEAAVERYDGDGKDDMKNLKYPVKYWEIINEPSMRGSLTFFAGKPKAYVSVMKATYDAVKKSDEKAKVMNGGLAGDQPFVLSYWRKVMKNGGKKYFNIFNFHCIGGQDKLGIPKIKKFKKKYKIKGKMWMPELEFEAFAQNKVSLTSEEWSIYMVQQYVYAFFNNVTRIFYVGLTNAPGDSESWLIYKDKKEQNKDDKKEPEKIENIGSISAGTKQATYYAFQTMVNKLENYTKVKKITVNQYKFKVGKKWIYVLWGDGSVPSELTGQVSMSDVYGNEGLINVIDITLGESPVYITR